MICWTEYGSPLGRLTLAEEEGSLVGLWLPGQKYFPEKLRWEQRQTPVLLAAEQWLDRYFAGERPVPGELPLAPGGSEFRRQVLAFCAAFLTAAPELMPISPGRLPGAVA